MARINPKLEPLLRVLQDQGFGWLSAEILELIERGRTSADDLDYSVAERRSRMRGRKVRGDKPDQDADGADETPKARVVRTEPYAEDEQVELAVDHLLLRLESAANWFAKSEANLSQALGRSVELDTTEDDSHLQRFDRKPILEGIGRLRASRTELIDWLRGQGDEG